MWLHITAVEVWSPAESENSRGFLKGEMQLEAEGQSTEELLDWRFRSVGSIQHIGKWRGSFFTLGVVCFGSLGSGGIFFNLVLYLMRVWDESSATASNDMTNLQGTMYFTALIGAFLGDAYLGRLWTVLLFLVIYATGSVLVGVAVTLQERATEPLPENLKAFLFAALYITAVGNGSHDPVLQSLGGDQFDSQTDKTTFFNWFFVFSNVGQLVALSFVTYFQNNGQWALGFWISGGVVLLSIPVYMIGMPFSRQLRPGGNPFSRVLQVFICAFRNVRVSPAGTILYQTQDEVGLPLIPGSRRFSHSKDFRWLDRAAVVGSPEDKGNPWRVCTVTQVEEVKCLLRVAPVFVAGVLFNTIIAQLTTLFIAQGATMDGHIGKHFNMPPGSMQAFTVLACISFTPFFDYVVVPWLRKRTGYEKGLRLQKMGLGMALSIVAMVVAVFVERKRLYAARSSPLIDVPYAVMPVSMYWLVPQYVLLGIALVFAIVGQMDFFYSELSDGMRSIGSSLPLLCRGLGNYASTLLITIVTDITTRGGELGWIPRNINRGHIDRFYLLLAVIMSVTLVFYAVAAHFYTYRRVAPSKARAEPVDLTR
ncbi:hypothetical protein KP509_04G075000 [Ceratopteris richardii]|uniref:Uncharacterized protein n=1 Tax=Ceratopteris richardii TaxID=49495 RepID=A0A8T2UWY3_CERRI|nr:hypothetical protein KP509_04G075000 [Ceratopteris richardii]